MGAVGALFNAECSVVQFSRSHARVKRGRLELRGLPGIWGNVGCYRNSCGGRDVVC